MIDDVYDAGLSKPDIDLDESVGRTLRDVPIKTVFNMLLDELEEYADKAATEAYDKWQTLELKARQEGHIEKAHYFQRKKAYWEGVHDGYYDARYRAKLFKDEV